jgi:hypothetical protein
MTIVLLGSATHELLVEELDAFFGSQVDLMLDAIHPTSSH